MVQPELVMKILTALREQLTTEPLMSMGYPDQNCSSLGCLVAPSYPSYLILSVEQTRFQRIKVDHWPFPEHVCMP